MVFRDVPASGEEGEERESWFKGHLGSRGHDCCCQERHRAWDTDLYVSSSLLTPFYQRTPSSALVSRREREARDVPVLIVTHG